MQPLTNKACVISELVALYIFMPQRSQTLSIYKTKALKYLLRTHNKGHKNFKRKLEKQWDY